MKKKIRVGVIFGGRSGEHEVSLQSAKNVIDALNPKKYDVVLIGITKEGKWLQSESKNYLLNAHNPKLIALNNSDKPIAITPSNTSGQLTTTDKSLGKLDVIFPVLHGTYGEDGTIQGLLKLVDIPYVGPDVLGSAVGMDKDVMKRLLNAAGIPTAKFLSIKKHEQKQYPFETVKKKLGLPLFVKPANLGSSVGVYKVRSKKEFDEAVKNAFQFDNKILVEETIVAREIECSVLGNETPIASVPGEVILHHEFYSYDAKYIDENGASVEIPAKLPPNVVKKVQEMAIKAFTTLCCEGMARVDCFVTKKGNVLINEINTIPGFTNISMYPKLWEASGLSYPQLIDRLIELGIARHERDKKLKTSL